MLDGALEQVSRDHRLVQELVDAGRIPPEAADGHPHANIVIRAIGAGTDSPFALDKISDALRPGERFLPCHDGLTKCVPETVIAALLRLDDPPEELIAAALDRRARDNVPAVVIKAPQ